MSPSAMGSGSDALRQQVLAQAGSLEKFQRELKDLHVEATSPDGSVVVSVGGQGQLVGMTFHGDRHRDLNGPDLAELILKTATSARESALSKIRAAVPSSGIPGVDLGRMFEPGVDVTDLMSSMTEHLTKSLESSMRGLL
jgi:DNA-binding protein YbaB